MLDSDPVSRYGASFRRNGIEENPSVSLHFDELRASFDKLRTGSFSKGEERGFEGQRGQARKKT